MALGNWKERIVTFTGTADAPLFQVPAGCSVIIQAVNVNVAAGSGTFDIKDGTTSAVGSNVLMATAAVAPTATGLKGNTATGITAIAASPAGFLFTTAGAVWGDSGTLTGSPSITVFALVRKVFPGEGEL